jgi:hypothetical protein
LGGWTRTTGFWRIAHVRFGYNWPDGPDNNSLKGVLWGEKDLERENFNWHFFANVATLERVKID